MSELTTHQRKILENRKPSLGRLASQGDKVARHMLSNLGFDTDYLEKDMDGPQDYQLAE